MPVGAYSGSCYSKYGGTGRTRSCSSGCGTQVSVSTCGGESWSGSCWSPSGAKTETKPCNQIQSNLRGTATRYCSATCSGSPSCPAWTTSGCSVCGAPAGEPASRACPAGYTGTQTRTWNTSACSWSAWQGTCTPKDPCAGKTCSGPTSQSCPSGQTGTQTRTCTCGVWSQWTGTCTPKPTCSDASYKASHKSECCPSTSTSDSVCYKDCSTSSKSNFRWSQIDASESLSTCTSSCCLSSSRPCGGVCNDSTYGNVCDSYSPACPSQYGTRPRRSSFKCVATITNSTYRCKNGW